MLVGGEARECKVGGEGGEKVSAKWKVRPGSAKCQVAVL